MSDDYNQPVLKYDLYRGWKAIASVLGCSIETAKKMHNENGLPVRDVGGTPHLSSLDLDRWYQELPRLKKLKLFKKTK